MEKKPSDKTAQSTEKREGNRPEKDKETQPKGFTEALDFKKFLGCGG